MKWYAPTILKVAAKPPSYMVERISDLQHACDVSKTSPREANTIISHVIGQLSVHHDDAFIPPLKEAGRIMLDSPTRAAQAIEQVVAAMVAEKEIMESAKEEDKWTK